jgi:arginase
MEPMSSRSLAVLGVPSNAGGRSAGLEAAPGALRKAGLIARLRESGLSVADEGDLPRLDPDQGLEDPNARKLGLVARVAAAVAARLKLSSPNGTLPVVLGGDCTITIGVLSGLLVQGSDLGLLYFDGDLDLNTPATTPSGFFDGMVAAHILGAGAPELARIGPRFPLVQEPHLAFFGYDATSGWVDPPELRALERSATLRYPIERIRPDPLAAAAEALRALESRVPRILVHFDVDASDIAAADLPHPGGLPFDRVVAVLGSFLASPKCAGLVVTEFNPRRDPDGSLASRLASGLAEALRNGNGRSRGAAR